MTVFEKADRIGGLLRYGIPDFKMEKHLIDRRIRQMEAEGVVSAGVNAGVAITADQLKRDYDAVVLAMGSEQPRDLKVPGRELNGVHFAMEFLPQQNKVVRGRHGAGSDFGNRQARHHHRRRRHRRGLPRHIPPARRGFGDTVRNHADAARDAA